VVKGLLASATREPRKSVDLDSFAAASLRSEYKPD